MSNNQHQEHDIALTLTKYLYQSHTSKLQIRFRSQIDPMRMIAVAEVDDAQSEFQYVAFEIRNYSVFDDDYIVTNRPKATLMDGLRFRAPIPEESDYFQTLHVPVRSFWNNQKFNVADIDAQAKLNNSAIMNGGSGIYDDRFTFRRWVFLRSIGAVDIDWIKVGPAGNSDTTVVDIDY